VLLASVLFMRRMATTTEGRFSHDRLPGPLPEGVVVYDLVGPLFFGAAERAMGAIRAIDSGVRVVIFRMEQLLTVDVTGLVALEGVLEELERHGIKAVLVGVRRPARELFARAGLAPVKGKLAFCDDMESAFRLLGARVRGLRRMDIGPVRVDVLRRRRKPRPRPPDQLG
jgi:SulP family sulfate permease